VFVSHKNLRDFFLCAFGGMLTEHKNPMGHIGKQNNPHALGHSIFQNAQPSVLLCYYYSLGIGRKIIFKNHVDFEAQ
jgi:hypothetical protein